MAAPDPFAVANDVVDAWRPLSSAETEKATYWIDRTSRRIRVLWPDIDDRIAAGTLDPDDVRDEVVDVVIAVLDTPKAGRHYKSYTRGSGSENVGYTLRDEVPGGNGWVVPTDSLVDLLGPPVTASRLPLPVGVFPPAPGFDRIDRPRRTITRL